LAHYERSHRLRVVFAVSWRFSQEFPAWLGYPEAQVIPVLPEQPLSPLFRAIRPHLLVSPVLGAPPFDEPEAYGCAPHVTIVADVFPLDRPHLGAPAEAQFLQRLILRSGYVTKIVTPSDYSRRRLLERLKVAPEQVAIIPWAGDLRGQPALIPPISAPYLFYPAYARPNKRHALLLQIMQQLWQHRPELKLVLTGGREPGFIERLIECYACPPDRVVDLGFVSDEQLITLYRHAEAMLFVSEYEGFGLPLLEAMANRCPVICAPLTVIPEVAGEAELYVDSTNPADWAEVVLKELPIRRAELIKKGLAQASLFSWERVRREWEKLLVEAGLQLSVTENNSGGMTTIIPQNDSLSLPLSVVTQELTQWSVSHAAQQAELEAKEELIQSLVKQFVSPVEQDATQRPDCK